MSFDEIRTTKSTIRAPAPSSRNAKAGTSSRSECIDVGHGVKAFGNERNLPWLWVMLPGATRWLQER